MKADLGGMIIYWTKYKTKEILISIKCPIKFSGSMLKALVKGRGSIRKKYTSLFFSYHNYGESSKNKKKVFICLHIKIRILLWLYIQYL